ncbi:LEA type 2 family protein [Propionivibrio dicarboxylicus]|uniref:LEA14-like dessication related protein n=1 Tax=Propionivibrio dicarboxylicus TaxID=83767 RepID=A0A1G8FJL8_9RHOO|nr:LEA type 2 family protein [Propionivibrio dicarboxylicus]SDH82216.1 LEA14-like dessication related protein [Propionivibrio dicarboxylicus]
MRLIRGFWTKAMRQGGLMLACLVLASCSSLLKAPEVDVASIELAGFNLSEQRFALVLDLRNPNPVELSLRRLDFSVELDGRPFAQGHSVQPVRVPANGTAQLDVQAVSRLTTLLERLRAARSDGRARLFYRIFGSAELDGVGTLPFDRQGSVPSWCANCDPARGRSGSSKGDKPL